MKLILGGGLGGLSAAYYLSKLGHKVILFEASKRVGGWARSHQIEENVVFNEGPRTFRTFGDGGANTLTLVDELGLHSEILPRTILDPVAKNRLIYVNKKLHLLPSGLITLLKKRPPFTKSILLSAFMKDLRTPPKLVHDDSLYDFVERRMGKEIADYASTAIVRGICAGDAKEISVKSLMKNLFEYEQKYGSCIKGMWKKKGKEASPYLWSESKLYVTSRAEKWSGWILKSGMDVLPQKLKSSIESNGGEIHTDSPCTEIAFEPEHVKVKVSGKVHEASHLISALPAYKLAQLVRSQHPELGKELASIPFVTVATVNLHFKPEALKLKAFGFLVPSTEDAKILGVIFDSCYVDCGDKTVLTVMMGGRWFEEHLGSNPTEDFLLETALRYLHDILNISVPPQNYKVSILRDCIPQYVVGHVDRVQRIKQYIQDHKLPLTLVGSSYNGVGMNDVLLDARKTVDELVDN